MRYRRDVTDSTVSDGPSSDVGSADYDRQVVGARPLAYRTFGVLLSVLGAIGLAGSFWLSYEKIESLLHPDRVASCTINVFLSCGDAMGSWQGSLLGFPNPFLGVAAFPVVITTGVVILTRVRLPRWYWLCLLGGTVLGQALIFFLMWTSFYTLVKLCPACMVVWTIMWPLLWFQVTRAVQERLLPVGEGLRRAVVGNRGVVLLIGYVVAIGWLLLTVGGALFDSFGL